MRTAIAAIASLIIFAGFAVGCGGDATEQAQQQAESSNWRERIAETEEEKAAARAAAEQAATEERAARAAARAATQSEEELEVANLLAGCGYGNYQNPTPIEIEAANNSDGILREYSFSGTVVPPVMIRFLEIFGKNTNAELRRRGLYNIVWEFETPEPAIVIVDEDSFDAAEDYYPYNERRRNRLCGRLRDGRDEWGDWVFIEQDVSISALARTEQPEPSEDQQQSAAQAETERRKIGGREIEYIIDITDCEIVFYDFAGS